MPRPNLSAYENSRRTPSPKVLQRITSALAGRPSHRVERHREAIRSLAREYQAASPRIFGSVARGEDQPGSDLDLLDPRIVRSVGTEARPWWPPVNKEVPQGTRPAIVQGSCRWELGC